MDFSNCCFYQLNSKQKLKQLLFIKRDVYLQTSFINSKINVYFNKQGRLIEAPDPDIKAIQRNILRCLEKIEIPDYIYYGVRNRSFNEMQAYHNGRKFTFCIDIYKFFYNIRRNNIYLFFRDTLKTSPDVAGILADYSSINLELKNYCNDERILNLVNNKKIAGNHLMAGAPQSPVMSYLVNEEMFGELNKYALNHGFLFSAYADDLYFSTDEAINEEIKHEIIELVNKFNFNISEEKMKLIVR